MSENNTAPQTIDEYIAQFPPEIQEKLEAIRRCIREAAPEATEKISWGMPTFYLYGNLVHFAANKRHVGFYPGASGVEAFLKESTAFSHSKGAIQFPYDKPMPIELVTRIVKFRVVENKEQAQEKQTRKK